MKSKLPGLQTNIFSVMTAMAKTYGAINLAQGFPDFPADQDLIRLVSEAMQKGYNQYAPMPGLPSLRSLIASRYEERQGRGFDPETELTITSGATEALFCTIQALIQQGDEVIVIEPAYDAYIPAIQLAGGVPVPIGLEGEDLSINWSLLNEKISDRTKMIIINTPHNPTGKIFSFEDWERLAKIVLAYELYILSDEVYDAIIYDQQKHVSAGAIPLLKEKAIVVGSFGKSLSVTGWKVGYCFAPLELSKEIRKVHQYVTFSVSYPFQLGIDSYIREFPERIDQLSSFFQEKRDYFLQLIEQTALRALPCEGSYFLLANYSHIKDVSEYEFATFLTKEIGVAVVPVSVFYHDQQENGWVRFCFAKETSTLDRAFEKLKHL